MTEGSSTSRSPLALDQGVFINLPVLNEAESVRQLLDRIHHALRGLEYTVCVVDDGSTDGTLEILARLIREQPHRLHLIQRRKTQRGCQRGAALHAALQWGLRETGHGIFVEMDGDLSHRPEELADGIKLVADGCVEIAIASKYLPGARVVSRPIGRRLFSRLCNFAVRIVISRRVSDYSNGFRFYSRRAAQLIAEHEIRYGNPIYLTEVMAIWLRHGVAVGEFPSLYVGRHEGLSKVRWGDFAKASLAAIEIALRYHLTGFSRIAEGSCCSFKPVRPANP